MDCDSVRAAIAALGGIRAVSELTGHSYVTVSGWQARFGRFPPRTYALLQEELAKRGHTAPPELWLMMGRKAS